MYNYLITLTPTGRFFFGGNLTFSDGMDEYSKDFWKLKDKARILAKKKIRHSSYIIHSEKFPQQTSLLGMLRFLILRNDNEAFDAAKQVIKDRGRAEDLIGRKSFDASESIGKFGYIKNLSHCFIQANKGGGWANLSISPKDAHLGVDFSEFTAAFVNDCPVEIPKMDYSAKDGIVTAYLCPCCGQETKESDIFQEDIRNGISRDIETGLTSDNALFKQVSYRLKEGYRFAFYAEVEFDIAQYKHQVVSVGADSSQFIIGIEECNVAEKENDPYGNKVVLLSPAYIEDDDLKDVRFSITETIPFKCMKTTTRSAGPYSTNLQLSAKLFLYTPGSVFYFRSKEGAVSFTEKLKGHAAFYQIGYNRFKITD